MMKKILSLALAMMLLLGAVSALAEEYKIQEGFQALDVQVKIPEGYTVEQVKDDDWAMITFHPDSADKPTFDMTVSPSEDYDGKSLGELSEEEKQAFVDNILSMYDNPSHELFKTPAGNLILFSQDSVEGGNFAVMQTLYKGYYFTLMGSYDSDYRPLTEADLTLMHQITEGTDIIPAGK